ncbi:eukaryotic translation initiation factor 4B-like isoform X2 [Rhynchophorus ferrugineus]|uniref:eukaryotic translation initiation factor 4B-like isoform X2 n=1 Tax=Rhynchophorus ferrugineus TaxID=354439 RepID=UPI003FCC2D45
MASGKKGKKIKGKTLALTDFLQETTGSLPSQPIRKSTASWAEEVDSADLSSTFINVVLPTAPKASRDYDDIASKVPKEPPFIAYLSNLPYDIDEDEIATFFKNMRISNMRIPKNDRPGDSHKLKGYGYVEFEDRESLMNALIIPDMTLKNRRIRIEVATNTENDRRRGGPGGRMGISDRLGSTDTSGDWRSTNRPEPVEDRRGFNRDNMRDGGGFKDREGGFTRDFTRDRDSTITRNRDQDNTSWRDDRQNRDSGFSRPSYRDDRGGFRRFDDKDDRNGFHRGGSRVERDKEDSEQPNSEPRQRPKLKLAPRTKPIQQQPVTEAPKPVGSASIFGNAKPVDTTERDREIEEKLRQQQERLVGENKDKKVEHKDRSGDNSTERKPMERARPTARPDNKDRDRPEDREARSEDRKGDDDQQRSPPSKNDNRSPDDRRKLEKPPKREEKRSVNIYWSLVQ